MLEAFIDEHHLFKAQPQQTIQGGYMLPNLLLHITENTVVKLHQLTQDQNIILFFYPRLIHSNQHPSLNKIRTLIHEFHHHLSTLNALNTNLFGVNLHTPEQQIYYKKADHLHFNLISDEHRLLTHALGIPYLISSQGEHAIGQCTIIAQRGGIVRAVLYANDTPSMHLKQIIHTLSTLL